MSNTIPSSSSGRTISDYATVVKLNDDVAKIKDLQANGAQSKYYDASKGSVQNQQFAATSDMYDVAGADTLTNNHQLKSDINALGSAELNGSGDVSGALSSFQNDLSALLQSGTSAAPSAETQLISDTEAAEKNANADYTAGLQNNNDSDINASHNEELMLASKLVDNMPANPTAVQSAAFAALKKSLMTLDNVNAQYATDPSQRDAAGVAGEQVAADVRTAVESLKTSA